MNKKERRLKKINQNLDIETILDEKQFSENVQSLILSMFYKIENAYSDYYNVKRTMPVKEQFLECIIRIIKESCNNIEFINPNEVKEEQNFKIIEKHKKIQCLENEDILLFGLFQLIKLEIQDNNLTDEIFKQILKYGNGLNYQEVIRAFNGWSWNDSLSRRFDIQCNLIYQNLLIMFNNEIMQEIIKSKDIVMKIKDVMQDEYNNELIKKFIYILIYSIISVKISETDTYKIKCQEYLKELENNINKLKNKERFISDLTIKRKNIVIQIREIDEKLNNITFLKKEFEDKNKKLKQNNKIFSISDLAEMYEEKREKLLKEMSEYSRLLNPQEYINKTDELKNNIEIYNNLNLKLNCQKNAEQSLQNLQQIFLQCFTEKINNSKDKKDVIELIYKFRYYQLLKFNEDSRISDLSTIKENLEDVLKALICKAEELKAIEKFTNDIESNLKIVQSIFTNEILNLENIVIQILEKDNKNEIYKVQYYDGVMLSKEVDITLKDVNIKKRKSRMFI